MEFLPTGLAGDDISRGLQVLDPAGNVGIARGPSRLAVIFMIHSPAIKTMACEFIHDRILAVPRHVEIEAPGGHRRAMDEEQHGTLRLAGFRGAKPFAKHPQRDIAFLSPIFAAPDFIAL